jgi:LruC domain-containing protein
MKFSGNLTITMLLAIFISNTTLAQTAPSWGDAESFAVLGSLSVSSTGPTVITGNVGVSPGLFVTGFPPATIKDGAIYKSIIFSLAASAQISAKQVYYDLTAQNAPTGNNLSGKVLGQTSGATTLTPGVYTFNSSAQLNSTLILNDGGNPNAVFIFKIGSTLNTANNSKVIMSSGGKGPNVFWQIGSSANIGDYTTFVGNIIAMSNITMNTGATTTGRLFSLRGSIIMDTNTAFAVDNEILDTDRDGIPDSMDDYPKDANKAFDNYSSTSGGSTCIFEDQWPIRGDFDLNDLVMLSNYQVVTNAKNVVVQVIGTYTLLATGGDFKNGYGVEFPFPTTDISDLKGGVLEAGQKKAVVILFKDMHTEMVTGNTVPGSIKSPPKTYIVDFSIKNGPFLSDFGFDFNQFTFNESNGVRAEVHLPGKMPTDLASAILFLTGDDNSNLALGKSYVTKTGLPYAISLPASKFDYPIEGKDINKAYLHFAEWAQSGGILFKDWYSNLSAGYRNTSLIYTK